MSDQQAQELTPEEAMALTSFLSTVTFSERAKGVMRGLVMDAFRAGVLAARAPVPVERPDEDPRPGVRMMERVLAQTGICPICRHKSASFPTCDDAAPDGQRADSSSGAEPSTSPARLPEQPDEGAEREWKAEDGEPITRAFHDAYERLAPTFGYETREASAVAWEDVPAENKGLMRATIGTLLCEGVILPGPLAARPTVPEEGPDAD